MGVRRARAVLPSHRVRLALIGPKLLWERKFGKFHTSRSRAAGDINTRARRGQTVGQSRARFLRLAKRREQKHSNTLTTNCTNRTLTTGFPLSFLLKKTFWSKTPEQAQRVTETGERAPRISPFYPHLSGIFSTKRCLLTWWKKTRLLRWLRPRPAWTPRRINPRLPQSTERYVRSLPCVIVVWHVGCYYRNWTAVRTCGTPLLTRSLALFFIVVQTHHGEKETSQNQRKLGTAQNADPGCSEKRCKYDTQWAHRLNHAEQTARAAMFSQVFSHTDRFPCSFLFRAPDTRNWRRRTSWRWLWNTSETCSEHKWLVSPCYFNSFIYMPFPLLKENLLSFADFLLIVYYYCCYCLYRPFPTLIFLCCL